MSDRVLLHPVTSGTPVPLSQVSDPVFSQQMLGPGAAMRSPSGEVVAPASGVITLLYRTHHALILTTDGGMQLLVHVGVDTVSTSAGFQALVEQGQHVQEGDPLLRVDWQALKDAGRDTTTVVVAMNDPNVELEFRS